MAHLIALLLLVSGNYRPESAATFHIFPMDEHCVCVITHSETETASSDEQNSGGKIIQSPEQFRAELQPGHMWMPLLTGEHVGLARPSAPALVHRMDHRCAGDHVTRPVRNREAPVAEPLLA